MGRRKPPTRAKPNDPAVVARAPGVDLTRVAETQQAVFRGFLLYVQNPGLTVRKVWDTGRMVDDDDTAPYIKDLVTWKNFEKWAGRGRWSAKRDEHWHDIEQRVLAEAKNDTVSAMLTELENLQAIDGVILNNIQGVPGSINPAKPKSLEGMVAAYINLDKWRQTKREKVLGIQAAAAGHEVDDGVVIDVTPEVPAVEDALTDEEVRALSEQLAMQRAGLIAGPAEDAEEVPADEDADGEE